MTRRPLVDTDRRLRPEKRPEGYSRAWTEEEDAFLTQYWPDHSSQWIGDRLGGRTRNSVISRAGRLYLEKAPKAPPVFWWTGPYPALNKYIALRTFA